jgi:hypothetical protein
VGEGLGEVGGDEETLGDGLGEEPGMEGDGLAAGGLGDELGEVGGDGEILGDGVGEGLGTEGEGLPADGLGDELGIGEALGDGEAAYVPATGHTPRTTAPISATRRVGLACPRISLPSPGAGPTGDSPAGGGAKGTSQSSPRALVR